MTFGGLPTRWEPTGDSRGLALVVPGRAYSPTAPLLEFARQAFLQHHFSVQQIWWDTTTRCGSAEPDVWVRQPDQAEAWVRRQVAEALAEELADHVVIIGKSLGTRAAAYAAERGLDAIWFTPLLVDPTVVEAIGANAGRQLLVGGLADELWDADVARELGEAGCQVLEVADADHGMGTSDVVRTVEIHLEVARAVEAYVSGI